MAACPCTACSPPGMPSGSYYLPPTYYYLYDYHYQPPHYYYQPAVRTFPVVPPPVPPTNNCNHTFAYWSIVPPAYCPICGVKLSSNFKITYEAE